MELGIRDKVALVAASSRGLGRAIAEALGAEGASIIICSRNAEELEVTKRSIESRTGANVHAIAADLSDSAQIERLAKEAIAKRGRVDILVNNAGGPPAGRFEVHDWAAWERAVNLNLRSAVELTRALLPGMRERKWGRIINVTSITAKQPVENLILSNSIRSAVTGFARTLANEVATDGITVNNILPGFTRTERVEELADATAKTEGLTRREVVARFESQIPMRRLGEPEEFAALAAFLASSQASYITGQSVAVDGGWIRALVLASPAMQGRWGMTQFAASLWDRAERCRGGDWIRRRPFALVDDHHFLTRKCGASHTRQRAMRAPVAHRFRRSLEKHGARWIRELDLLGGEPFKDL